MVDLFKNELNVWIITFGICAILFNPIIPVYLKNKLVWHIIDVAVAVLFIIKASGAQKAFKN